MQLEKSRENIREAVKFCEDSEGDKPIPQELFDEDGEIEEENICCSRCGLPDSEDVRLQVFTRPASILFSCLETQRRRLECF